MDDAELDRALKAALSISPSPEFVAKVRAAIDEEPTGGTATSWLVRGTALAFVAALVIAVTHSVLEREVPAEIPVERYAGANILLVPAPAEAAVKPLPQVAHRETPRQPKGRDAFHKSAASPKQDFDVMISPTDAAAYKRLFENVGSTTYRLADQPPVEPENKVMTALDIAPIEIAPLDEVTDSMGVFQ